MDAAASICEEPPQEVSSNAGTEIKDVLARRSDLSTFVVHLTRDANGQSAKDCLESIVRSWKIEAKNAYGSAAKKLTDKNLNIESQKCICFTETPLEYLYLLIGEIAGRKCDFGPFGVAVTKRLARKGGANPVWYVDITSGHSWLMNPINELIDQSLGTFDKSSISKITPFIEQMGTGNGYRKEFWWEREWRHVGDFALPEHVILICPDEDGNHENFERLAQEGGHSARCIDPGWGLEQIIARLAGFDRGDIEILC